MKTNKFLLMGLTGMALLFTACKKNDPNPDNRLIRQLVCTVLQSMTNRILTCSKI